MSQEYMSFSPTQTLDGRTFLKIHILQWSSIFLSKAFGHITLFLLINGHVGLSADWQESN